MTLLDSHPAGSEPDVVPRRAVSLAGVRTVAKQEFRLRLRAGRWRVLLGLWFLVLLGLTALLRRAFDGVEIFTGSGVTRVDIPSGPPVFGSLMLLVLALALLVVPSLTAQSVNGDRERGTLATVQTTLLTPAEIALGKLAAAWGSALVLLVVSLPMVAWAMTGGGVPAARVAVTLLVVALLLGVVCALAQAFSALLARSTTSGVVSYLAVFALTVGTAVVFGLGLAATTSTITVTQQVPAGPELAEPVGEDGNGCPVWPEGTNLQEETFDIPYTHQERVWWLLAPNPFVILADAAPRSPRPTVRGPGGEDVEAQLAGLDPLGGLGDTTRRLRVPSAPPTPCGGSGVRPPEENREGPPVWPWGLGFNVLLGVGAVLVTIRRLRTPTRTLPRGVRVA